jgi:hypothetical protein
MIPIYMEGRGEGSIMVFAYLRIGRFSDTKQYMMVRDLVRISSSSSLSLT